MVENRYVVSIDDIRNHLGKTRQADYIFRYLKNDLNAETVIVEDNYRDKDYLIDYSGFYARAFEDLDRTMKRIHFFTNSFEQKDFEQILKRSKKESNLSKRVQRIFGEYLGFVVIKPFKNEDGEANPSIGRSLLVPLSSNADGGTETRCYLGSDYKSNLYGIPLKVHALPFQAQDQAVAACATISLWIANSKLNDTFRTPPLSPVEITNRAISLIGDGRNLPSEGLTLKQMLAFLRSIELDYDIVNISGMMKLTRSKKCSKLKRVKSAKKIENIISDTVKAFIPAKIPIIVGIRLNKYGQNIYGRKLLEKSVLHAVVISGFRQDLDGNITKLYVHDDQIGPYCRVESASFKKPFTKWNDEWNKGHDPKFDEIVVEKLVIPLYPKIRLNYNKIYEYYLFNLKDKHQDRRFTLELATIQEYKEKLLFRKFSNKLEILKKPMPRFIWIIGMIKDHNKVYEELYDATSHYIRKVNVGPIYYDK